MAAVTFSAKLPQNTARLATAADLRPGQNVLYKGRAATVAELGTGSFADGSVIHLARIRFPRGGVSVVFANQLEQV